MLFGRRVGRILRTWPIRDFGEEVSAVAKRNDPKLEPLTRLRTPIPTPHCAGRRPASGNVRYKDIVTKFKYKVHLACSFQGTPLV